MLPTLNYDAVLSDPLLLLAGVFLIVGPLVFLVSLIKLLASKRKQKQEAEFSEMNPFSPIPPSSASSDLPETPPLSAPPYMEEQSEPEPPLPVQRVVTPSQPEIRRPETPLDKTMIMSAGVGEIQGQLEIAFTQIKTLSKKVSQMESELDSVARTIISKLDKNELKEVPMNPADFTQKLLKLAEHVIVLEKEVERMKINAKKKAGDAANADEAGTEAPLAPERLPSAPSTPKSPMMPL